MTRDTTWEQYVRHVTRLVPEPQKPVKKCATKKISVKSVSHTVNVAPVSQPQSNPSAHTVDLALQRRLKRGEVMPQARIDLHGMTQSEAFESLIAFLQRAVSSGLRVVLVVTGKGRGGSGILRQSVPKWCASPPLSSSILGLVSASQRHGGEGAVYIVTRRKRNNIINES